MNHSSWVDPRLDRLTVDNIRTYLLGRGWRLQPYPGPELLVFEGPPDDDGLAILQVVPSSERLHDFPMRIADLLGALGVVEDRPAAEVLTDMLAGKPVNGAVGQPFQTGIDVPVGDQHKP